MIEDEVGADEWCWNVCSINWGMMMMMMMMMDRSSSHQTETTLANTSMYRSCMRYRYSSIYAYLHEQYVQPQMHDPYPYT